MSESEKFDTWAIVEIMGHRKLAGRVSEQSIAGAAFVRIDVPEIPEHDTGYRVLAAKPAYTQYFGGSSIFSLTPCDEATAIRTAVELREYPIELVRSMPQPQPPRIEARRDTDHWEDDLAGPGIDPDDDFDGE